MSATKTCLACGREFTQRPREGIKRFARRVSCSRSCGQRNRPVKPLGPNTRYRKVKVDGRTKNLSRHLVEQQVGRTLARNELVHHKNHNKLDDRLDNYELTTPKAHSQHHNQKHPITKPCAQCGNDFTPNPTKRARQVTCSRECFSKWAMTHAAKLTPEDVRRIREEAASGATTRELADRYGVDISNVRIIIARKTWRHVA